MVRKRIYRGRGGRGGRGPQRSAGRVSSADIVDTSARSEAVAREAAKDEEQAAAGSSRTGATNEAHASPPPAGAPRATSSGSTPFSVAKGGGGLWGAIAAEAQARKAKASSAAETVSDEEPGEGDSQEGEGGGGGGGDSGGQHGDEEEGALAAASQGQNSVDDDPALAPDTEVADSGADGPNLPEGTLGAGPEQAIVSPSVDRDGEGDDRGQAGGLVVHATPPAAEPSQAHDSSAASSPASDENGGQGAEEGRSNGKGNKKPREEAGDGMSSTKEFTFVDEAPDAPPLERLEKLVEQYAAARGQMTASPESSGSASGGEAEAGADPRAGARSSRAGRTRVVVEKVAFGLGEALGIGSVDEIELADGAVWGSDPFSSPAGPAGWLSGGAAAGSNPRCGRFADARGALPPAGDGIDPRALVDSFNARGVLRGAVRFALDDPALAICHVVSIPTHVLALHWSSLAAKGSEMAPYPGRLCVASGGARGSRAAAMDAARELMTMLGSAADPDAVLEVVPCAWDAGEDTSRPELLAWSVARILGHPLRAEAVQALASAGGTDSVLAPPLAGAARVGWFAALDTRLDAVSDALRRSGDTRALAPSQLGEIGVPLPSGASAGAPAGERPRDPLAGSGTSAATSPPGSARGSAPAGAAAALAGAPAPPASIAAVITCRRGTAPRPLLVTRADHAAAGTGPDGERSAQWAAIRRAELALEAAKRALASQDARAFSEAVQDRIAAPIAAAVARGRDGETRSGSGTKKNGGLPAGVSVTSEINAPVDGCAWCAETVSKSWHEFKGKLLCIECWRAANPGN